VLHQTPPSRHGDGIRRLNPRPAALPNGQGQTLRRLLPCPSPPTSRAPAVADDGGALRLRLRCSTGTRRRRRRRCTSRFQAEAVRGHHGGGGGAAVRAPPAAVPVLGAAVALFSLPPPPAVAPSLPRPKKVPAVPPGCDIFTFTYWLL
jgi:hypothetical protein